MAEPVCGNRVAKLMGVVGHNGSGKTVLLKSLTYLHWFISQSFVSTPDSLISFYPHFIHNSEPSEFECTFDLDGTLWRYTLLCTSENGLA